MYDFPRLYENDLYKMEFGLELTAQSECPQKITCGVARSLMQMSNAASSGVCDEAKNTKNNTKT